MLGAHERSRLMAQPLLARGAAVAVVLYSASSAYAADVPPPPAPPDVPRDLGRLIQDTGRPPVKPAEPDLLRFQIHGEYQMRATSERSFPLDVSTHTINDHPGAIEDSLGQNRFLNHWLRITPRLQIKDKVEL